MNIQHGLGLDLFVLHGEPVAGGERLRADIENQVREQAFDHPGGPVRIQFAAADDWSTVRGAAALVLSRSMALGF